MDLGSLLGKIARSDYPVAGKPYKTPGEEIIGIPEKGKIEPIRKIDRPEDWEFVVHDHHAEQAGRHFDLRIGDPRSGHGHSWALRHWPEKPGQKRLAVMQSTHSLPYFDWSGRITEGYGKGDVAIADRRKVQVIKSTPSRIDFAPGPNELYTLLRTGARDGKAWLLINRSETSAP